MINETTSAELKKIIKAGDYDGFLAIMKEQAIQADEHFYGKRESSCWPLIMFTLDNAFTNRNFEGRLKIATYLMKNGANLNDFRPYGASALYSLLSQHYYLSDINAKYEVWLMTLIFALELTRQESIDVTGSKKFDHLDIAIRLYFFHLERDHHELLKVIRQIVIELLQKGATYYDDDEEYLELIEELK